MIGGPGGAGNLISGNTGDGIKLTGASTTDTVIKGNKIGTNAAGTAKLSNTGTGVNIEGAPRTIVGGAASGEGNLISGNDMGVIVGFGAGDCVLKGNKIGTNATGTAVLGNQFDGILVSGGGATIIGGSASGEGNLIGGSGRNAISLWASSSQVVGAIVKGNLIGTDATLTTDLRNAENGVYVNGASGVTIGGTGAGEANIIVGGATSGVGVVSSTGVSVRRNTIYGFNGLAIDLGGDGPTANDTGDSDSGATASRTSP